MNDERIKAMIMAEFTTYMSGHRMRKTPERYAILEKVLDETAHFSVDNLYTRLEDEGYHVSKATIYSTMELLVDARIVRRLTFGTQTALYEKLAGVSSNHHHLVCTQCGKLREIKDTELDKHLSVKRYGTFHPLYADLRVYGICGRCMRKRKKPTKVTNDKRKRQ